MKKKFNCVIATHLFLVISIQLPAEEEKKQEPIKEEIAETFHSVTINGIETHYKATAGNLILKDGDKKDKASVFFIAYTKEGVQDSSTRPITYCFNGGPGSSAVWLHLGVFGPQKVALTDEGQPIYPYHLQDNPYSLLDLTDLVFIDPVSTGYSRPAPGEDPKQFHGVEEDIQSVGEFISLYTTRYNRWNSPKFLAGESYGTTRAAGLAGHLHEKHHIHLDGVILISSILNFQTILDSQRGNDQPYPLFLPTYTATAWYHNKLSKELQNRSLKSVLQEVEEFASNEYTLALVKGDTLDPQERQKIAQNLSIYTGLTPEFIDRSNIRINIFRFAKELLRDQKRTISRFDSRFKGIDADAAGSSFENDPCADAIFGIFTATLNHYVRAELKCEKDDQYEIIANVRPWNFENATNTYLNVAETLRDIISRNPRLRVFVASGYYDLATPYFATNYTFNHLGLEPELRNHIHMTYYDAGHMMYIHKPSLFKLKQYLAKFISSTLKDS